MSESLKQFAKWQSSVTPLERVELDKISSSSQEIEERFYTELAFGTAGMRGEVGLGTFRMNTYTVRRATAGLAKYIVSLGAEAMQRGVVIACDTRRFSKEFAVNVAEVLSYYKVKGFIFEDVRPVPICSFAVRHLNAIAGVMITASHNPKEYNGYKVYGEDGAQMSPEPTANVVKFIKAFEDYFAVPYESIPNSSNISKLDNVALNDYITVIGQSVDEEYYDKILRLSLSPELTAEYGNKIKLVYTPVHGAGYVPVTTVFNRLGIAADVVAEQAIADTEFSTVAVPNPENADTLAMGMAMGDKVKADVVLGTDPDCDRLGVAVRDNSGKFILLTGNQIGVLLLDYILTKLTEDNKMPANPAVVRSFVTTTLADRMATKFGASSFSVLTGFKYIGEKIKEWEENGKHEYVFGFEESFGSLRGTHARDKDAVVASMLFAEMVIYHTVKGVSIYQRLQQIFAEFGYYVEKNESINYKGISGMADMAKVMAKLRNKKFTAVGTEDVQFVSDYKKGTTIYADGRTEALTTPPTDAIYLGLNDGQFICIRPSGTEPKLKLYVLIYANDETSATSKAQNLITALKEDL